MAKGINNQPHIGIFGRTNTGKSSLINILTGQDLAIVSAHPGTTTDPVKKSMEIKGIGPVVLIDTAGTEDMTELGASRLKKTISTIQKIDIAILLIDNKGLEQAEKDLIGRFDDDGLPFILIYNKDDISPISDKISTELTGNNYPWLSFSCENPVKLNELLTIIRENIE
jgi:small GTP-binding protein